MLLHGKKIGKNLSGMMLISQPIPDGHSGIRSQGFYQFLRETAILNAIIHATQHACGILHRFLISNVRATGTKIGNVGALIKGGHLKSTTSTRRVLLENQGNRLSLQALYLY